MKRIARIISLISTLIISLIITIVFALLAAATLRADDSEILDYVDTQVADVARTCASNSVEIANVARTCASNGVEIADVARTCASNSAAIAELTDNTSILSDSISTLSTNVYTKAEAEAKIVELVPQTETDPVWSAEKNGYATKDDLESGMLTVNRAEYAESARDAYSAEYATLAEGLRDGPTEIYAGTIFSRLDAAETTNAQQTAALDAKLDKTGGTMTGSLVVESIESNVHVGRTDSGAELTIGHLRHAPQLVKINCYGAIHIIDSETGSSRFIVQIPFKSGTLALLSDIPTTMAWSAITGKPTTISGYGITDALKSDFTSLTNNAAFSSAVAAVSPPADTSELEARGFVRIVADDEIYFVTITTTQTEE